MNILYTILIDRVKSIRKLTQRHAIVELSECRSHLGEYAANRGGHRGRGFLDIRYPKPIRDLVVFSRELNGSVNSLFSVKKSPTIL